MYKIEFAQTKSGKKLKKEEKKYGIKNTKSTNMLWFPTKTIENMYICKR